MQAVLYIAHGSRMEKGVIEAREFIESVKPTIDVQIQEICFLELAHPKIEEGVKQCVEKGATKIAIIPFLLLTAGHALEDIPQVIHEMRKNYPTIEFSYGETLGVDEKMALAVYERIKETNVPITNETVVLLVGRGSSVPSVKEDLLQIASFVQQTHDFKQVDVCFLYGAKPSFDDALTRLKSQKQRQVLIVPYLLFSGLLLNGMKRNILNEPYILTESLGYHEKIKELLIQRVNEAINQDVYV